MKSNRMVLTSPQVGFLSDSQKEEIHLATLEVLRRTGVRVFQDEALALLRKAGCTISDGNRVHIPSHLIEEAIRTAPASITTYDQNGEPAMRLESTNVHYGTGSDLMYTIDLESGERRLSRKSDGVNVARIADALPHIDFIMSMALPHDVPVGTSDLHNFEVMVTNSSKPIVYTTFNREGLANILDMAAAVAGDMENLRQKPFLILYAEPTTPLQHSEEAMDKLLLLAEHHLPIAYVPGIGIGGVTPVTKAGALVVANAELLSAILVAQLKRPGAPCIFGAGMGILDMRTTIVSYGAPEFMLMTSSLAELGRYYRLPTWGFGGCSDAKTFDQQAAMEGALWLMAAAMSGTNLVHDVGYIESGLTCSLEMLVSMDEMAGFVKSFMGGIEVSRETLALDEIHAAGPGGDFIQSDHTYRHFRDIWYPTLLDRDNYDGWEAQGRQKLGQRARDRAREILASHQPRALPPSVSEKLGEIIATAEANG